MKKVSAFILALFMLLTLISGCTAVKDGESSTQLENNNISYKYDEITKTLTIFGEGEMPYHNAWSAPWNDVEEPKHVVISPGLTDIADGAFDAHVDGEAPGNNYHHLIESVEIADTVTKIGNSAFSFCGNLKSITLPNSVTEIGEDAFVYCGSLKSIRIPDSVKKVASGAFYNCESLKNVKLGKNTTVIEGLAFKGCFSLEEIVIPKSVNRIGKDAFDNCADNFTIKGYKGTAAEKYAKKNGFKFVELS